MFYTINMYDKNIAIQTGYMFEKTVRTWKKNVVGKNEIIIKY